MDAHRRDQLDDPRDLLERQDLVALEPRQPLGGHAVLAAEVAAVGDRDAEIADRAAVAVVERLARHPHRLPFRACGNPRDVVGGLRRRWPSLWPAAAQSAHDAGPVEGPAVRPGDRRARLPDAVHAGPRAGAARAAEGRRGPVRAGDVDRARPCPRARSSASGGSPSTATAPRRSRCPGRAGSGARSRRSAWSTRAMGGGSRRSRRRRSGSRSTRGVGDEQTERDHVLAPVRPRYEERSTASRVKPARSATRCEAGLPVAASRSIRSSPSFSKPHRQISSAPRGSRGPAAARLAREPVPDLAAQLLPVEPHQRDRAEQLRVVGRADDRERRRVPARTRRSAGACTRGRRSRRTAPGPASSAGSRGSWQAATSAGMSASRHGRSAVGPSTSGSPEHDPRRSRAARRLPPPDDYQHGRERERDLTEGERRAEVDRTERAGEQRSRRTNAPNMISRSVRHCAALSSSAAISARDVQCRVLLGEPASPPRAGRRARAARARRARRRSRRARASAARAGGARAGRATARCASSASTSSSIPLGGASEETATTAVSRGAERAQRPRADRRPRASRPRPRSAFVTTSTSGTSMIPAFRNWSTSPDPGWTTTATVSATSATSVSDWPTPTVSITTTSNAAASAAAAARVAGASPPRRSPAAVERMNTRRSAGSTSIRARSPSSAPPERREVGSTASTATDRPRARHSATSRESSEDLPTPGGPVIADDVRRRLGAERRRATAREQRVGLLARLRRCGSRPGSAPRARR